MPKQPRTSANKRRKIVKEKISYPSKRPVIPYAKGFKPSSELQSLNAIGFCNKVPKEFDPNLQNDGVRFFEPIPKPESVDDWLAQYCEEGQTYKQYLNQCPWLSSRKRKYMLQDFTPLGNTITDKYPDGKIYIVPVGEFGDENLFASLVEYTKIFLGLPVVSLPNIKLVEEKSKLFWVEENVGSKPKKVRTSQRQKRHELNSRYSESTGQRQVCVDGNLMQLRKFIPRDALCMIGLTMMDLYGDDSDLFVAGMAAGNERVAIFSLFRYNPCLEFSSENWFEFQLDTNMQKKERQRTILQRGCKLLVHEICHLLGIDHCVFYECCMNGSGHLQEDFRQPMHLCPVDLHKLSTLVGFDVTDRYKDLLKFYKDKGCKPETQWMEKRIESLCLGD